MSKKGKNIFSKKWFRIILLAVAAIFLSFWTFTIFTNIDDDKWSKDEREIFALLLDDEKSAMREWNKIFPEIANGNMGSGLYWRAITNIMDYDYCINSVARGYPNIKFSENNVIGFEKYTIQYDITKNLLANWLPKDIIPKNGYIHTCLEETFFSNAIITGDKAIVYRERSMSAHFIYLVNSEHGWEIEKEQLLWIS